MSTTHLIFAGTLLCMSGVGLAQSSATQSTGSGIFQNPPAATAGDAKSGASASAPGTDPSGNKSFFESRSNAVRRAEDNAKPGVGQAAAGVPGNSLLNNTAPAQPAPR